MCPIDWMTSRLNHGLLWYIQTKLKRTYIQGVNGVGRDDHDPASTVEADIGARLFLPSTPDDVSNLLRAMPSNATHNNSRNARRLDAELNADYVDES